MKTEDIDLIQRVTGRPWITARSMLLGEAGIVQLLEAAREEGRKQMRRDLAAGREPEFNTRIRG